MFKPNEKKILMFLFPANNECFANIREAYVENGYIFLYYVHLTELVLIISIVVFMHIDKVTCSAYRKIILYINNNSTSNNDVFCMLFLRIDHCLFINKQQFEHNVRKTN